MQQRFFIATLGCPKNEVDSLKLIGRLSAAGYERADDPGQADLVVVNTCAFIEAAREESIEAILELGAARRDGARLVVTGCLAERAGEELADALPEVDLVAGFGVPVELTTKRRVVRAVAAGGSSFDLLELPRPASSVPWAYVKIAEGCDRRCGFCAIPSFRGKQRSRPIESILAEIEALEVREVVLVAQDLASYGRDRTGAAERRAAARDGGDDGAGIVELVAAAAARVERVRLLYLYPSSLSDRLIDEVAATGVPYFDLSLQHVSGRLLRAMRRYGNRERFLERIARIREVAPAAALRSSFILGYPSEREEDHDELLAFLAEAELDWAGFFRFSPEGGTLAEGLDEQVPAGLAAERLDECAELQDAITAHKRSALVGSRTEVLVDGPGIARSYREAPEIDGVISVPRSLPTGWMGEVDLSAAVGPDLEGVPVSTATAAAFGGLAS